MYKCCLKDDPEKVYAVKVVRSNTEETLAAHELEFKIIELLSHRNIIKGVEMFKDTLRSEIYQVIELIKGPEITELAPMSETKAQDLFK